MSCMEDEKKYKGCMGCSREEISTVQKFLGYNSLWYVFRNWFKIRLISKRIVPGNLR